jgi:hypothetical protein
MKNVEVTLNGKSFIFEDSVYELNDYCMLVIKKRIVGDIAICHEEIALFNKWDTVEIYDGKGDAK